MKPVPTELDECLLEISNIRLFYRETKEIHGFPKSTLQRYAVKGKKTLLSAGAPSKLTDVEFWSIMEKCRTNFISNQQTNVITLKKYVADVTDALGAQWLNGSAEGEHMKGLINRLKDVESDF